MAGEDPTVVVSRAVPGPVCLSVAAFAAGEVVAASIVGLHLGVEYVWTWSADGLATDPVTLEPI